MTPAEVLKREQAIFWMGRNWRLDFLIGRASCRVGIRLIPVTAAQIKSGQALAGSSRLWGLFDRLHSLDPALARIAGHVDSDYPSNHAYPL